MGLRNLVKVVAVVLNNIINSVSGPVSFYQVKLNILIPTYFGVPFQGVLGSLKNYITYIINII